MREYVERFIRKECLITPGQLVVVAVSGGPDSLSLLHLLHELSPLLGCSLHVVHVNHQLRPQAKAEELFVKKWALRMRLPVTICRIAVKKIDRQQQSGIQSAARTGRYLALIRVARRVGATAIATAHHLDDNVETLLLRLLTGSGLEGLKGIPLRRSIDPGLEIIRPFYKTGRDEIEAYCREYSLDALHDPSNDKTIYLRNRIRHLLIPFLETEFGNHLRQTLAQTAGLLAEDARILADLTNKVYDRVTAGKDKSSITLLLPVVRLQPVALQSRIIHKVLLEAGVSRVTASHVRQVLAVMNSDSPSASCSLPGGLEAIREYDILKIGRFAQEKWVRAKTILCLPGVTELPWDGGCIYAEFLSRMPAARPGRYEAYLDADVVVLPLHVRQREPGDRVRLFGRPGIRKLKEILIDAKIPNKRRDKLPLVASGNEIVWVAGVDIADFVQVTAKTTRVLHLKYEENDHVKRIGENVAETSTEDTHRQG